MEENRIMEDADFAYDIRSAVDDLNKALESAKKRGLKFEITIGKYWGTPNVVVSKIVREL